jgi:hypothetical protein
VEAAELPVSPELTCGIAAEVATEQAVGMPQSQLGRGT